MIERNEAVSVKKLRDGEVRFPSLPLNFAETGNSAD